jgi:hypothetical protein
VIAKHETGKKEKFDNAKQMEKWANKIQEKLRDVFVAKFYQQIGYQVIVLDGKAIGE